MKNTRTAVVVALIILIVAEAAFLVWSFSSPAPAAQQAAQAPTGDQAAPQGAATLSTSSMPIGTKQTASKQTLLNSTMATSSPASTQSGTDARMKLLDSLRK